LELFSTKGEGFLSRNVIVIARRAIAEVVEEIGRRGIGSGSSTGAATITN